MKILGMCLTAILPNRGKQRAPVEKAAYPCWASSVPIFCINPKRSLDRSMIVFYNCLQSFAFYKASFACF